MALATAKGKVTTWVSDLLPQDIGCPDSEIEVPDWAFRPDHWSAAFLRGLIQLAPAWSSKQVWEVGVGTGINLLALRTHVRDATWHFSDFDQRCVPLAIANILAVGNIATCYRPLLGQWDLVAPPAGKKPPRVNVVFGCLPQVPAEIDLTARDNLAHYYDPKRYPNAHMHPCGLALNEALLVRAREVLTPNGSVVLNLGGRPGLSRLKAMFKDNGYRPRVVHEETVPQHMQTSLASLAALERGGHAHFEFFADPESAVPISACEAEARRCQNFALFHKIYVIEGLLM